jgi:hypothetical protein
VCGSFGRRHVRSARLHERAQWLQPPFPSQRARCYSIGATTRALTPARTAIPHRRASRAAPTSAARRCHRPVGVVRSPSTRVPRAGLFPGARPALRALPRSRAMAEWLPLLRAVPRAYARRPKVARAPCLSYRSIRTPIARHPAAAPCLLPSPHALRRPLAVLLSMSAPQSQSLSPARAGRAAARRRCPPSRGRASRAHARRRQHQCEARVAPISYAFRLPHRPSRRAFASCRSAKHRSARPERISADRTSTMPLRSQTRARAPHASADRRPVRRAPFRLCLHQAFATWTRPAALRPFRSACPAGARASRGATRSSSPRRLL